MPVPVSTNSIQTAIETKRREDAALRWQQSFHPEQRPAVRDASASRSQRD
jgi:hypothetical protein